MNKIIEGMTVLEQTQIKEYTALSNFFSSLGIVTMVLGAIILIAFLIKKAKGNMYVDFADLNNIGLYLYLIGVVIALFSLIRFPWFFKETGRYTYECTIEDNVSANYISTNFDIIDVEDGVWTLKDKE